MVTARFRLREVPYKHRSHLDRDLESGRQGVYWEIACLVWQGPRAPREESWRKGLERDVRF